MLSGVAASSALIASTVAATAATTSSALIGSAVAATAASTSAVTSVPPEHAVVNKPERAPRQTTNETPTAVGNDYSQRNSSTGGLKRHLEEARERWFGVL